MGLPLARAEAGPAPDPSHNPHVKQMPMRVRTLKPEKHRFRVLRTVGCRGEKSCNPRGHTRHSMTRLPA